MMQHIRSVAGAKQSLLLMSIVCLIAAALLVQETSAINLEIDQSVNGNKPAVTLAVVENPELVARVLDNLLRSIIYSASVDIQTIQGGTQKRGLDLGISRGFSGSQAGKHLMGLSAASFANGPGRR